MLRMKVLPLLTLSTLLFALPGSAAERDFSTLKVATVNGDAVTIKDLRSQFKNRHGGHAKFLGGEQELRTFLRVAIDDRLLLQEAYEIQLDADPLVAREVEQFESNKAADHLVRIEIERKSEPSLDEIREIIRKYGDFLVQVREIGMHSKPEAEEIRNSLLRSADPEVLARSCSILQTRSRGGLRLVGWGSVSDPEQEALIMNLQPGEVSPVLEIDGTYQVVIGEGRIDAIRPELDAAKDAIAAILRKRKKDARERALAESVWSRYEVVVVLKPASIAELRKTFESAPRTIVARWNGGELTLAQTVNAKELASLATMPEKRALEQLDARVRATINSAVFALEARARKLHEVAEVADPVTDFREKLMLDALYGDHILKDYKLTEEDVRAYYDANAKSFFEPEKRRVAQILVASESDANAVAAELAKGKDFAELAKSKSRDVTTASSGGDLGWITADHVPPAFGMLFTLDAGTTTKPVRTTSGWHVIKVVEVQPKRVLSFEEAKESAAKGASEQKKRVLRDAWLEKLREAAKIEIDDAAIRDYVIANPIDPSRPAPAMQGMAPPSSTH